MTDYSVMPIDLDELRELIAPDKGIGTKEMRAHFNCHISKLRRSIHILTKEGFLFAQENPGGYLYYTMKYAKKNKLPKVVRKNPKPLAEYRIRQQEKKKEQIGDLDSQLWCIKLMAASKGR